MPAGPQRLSFYTLLWIVVLGALLRVFPLMTGTWSSIDVLMTYTTYDSNRYVVLADELLAGHGFTRPWEEGPVHVIIESMRKNNGTWPERDGRIPEGFRTPGYPLYLALFGGHPGIANALLVQCLLGALCSVLAALVAFRLGLSRRASYLVAALWAFHPAMATTDMLVLTESLFGMIGLAALAAAVINRGPAGLLLAGLLIGIDGLVRPLGLIYLVPVLILGWPERRKWLAVVFCLLAALTPSLLWMARNASVGQGWRVSTVSDINLYYYGGAYVLAESRGEDWKKAWKPGIEELSKRLPLAAGDDVFAKMRTESLHIYREHPTPTVKVALKSEVKLIFDHSIGFAIGQYREDFESSGLFSELMQGQVNFKKLTVPQFCSMLWMLLNAVIALLSTIGLLYFLRKRQWRLLFGCLLPVVLFSIASFPVGLERFRVPFMIYLFLPVAALLFRNKP